MEYDFFRLNPNDFEHMVQALARKIFGLPMITFGEGRDGGREAAFEGSYSCPQQENVQWKGYWVIQAKFKSKAEKDIDHFKWVKSQFEDEMKKFKKKTDSEKIPDNYLFFTNATLSGVEDVGGRDKIENLKKKYCTLIPNIMIYGCDDLRTFLDNNRDVAVTYSSFILPGDILKELLEMLTGFKEKEFNKSNRNYYGILNRFLHKEFRENLYPKLEQGGERTERLIKLEQVFVDLYATSSGLVPKDDKPEKKFVEMCIHRGDEILKQNRRMNRFVLVGSFGHGKSTLTQFLCQIYRAFFLKKLSDETSIEEVDEFIDKYCSYKKECVDCLRLPFKIDVNDYAGWVSKREGGQSCSVLAFLGETIREKADAENEISLNDLREILKNLSSVFVFDGLDEVAVASNRKEVIKQIDDFVDVELKHLDSDTLIVITTRPHGYKYEFNREIYEHRIVADLHKEDCLKYIHLLLENIELDDKKRSKHKDILQGAIDDPTIAELMKTPLQATIMAILVKSGGQPPKERYSLFDKYYKINYDRERQRGASRLLEELSEKCYKDIHKIFGFAGQKLSEATNAPSSSFNDSEFKRLIRSYLKFDELNEDEIADRSEGIKYDITRRLLFIVEDKEHIKFSIRALQEYFAALYFFNCREKIFPDRIRQISRSAYWRNTFLFGMGYIYNEQDYMLDHLYALCNELNGGGQDAGIDTIERVSKIGSWLALDILVDGIFRNARKYENQFAEFLKPLFELAPSEKHLDFSKLSEEILKNWVFKFIEEFLSRKEFKDQLTAWVIAARLIEHGYNELIDIVAPYWPRMDNQIFLIKYLHNMGLDESDWYITKFIDTLNGDDYEKLYSPLRRDIEIFKKIWIKRNHLNKRATGLLAEILFIHNPPFETDRSEYFSDFFDTRIFKQLKREHTLVPNYRKHYPIIKVDKNSATLKKVLAKCTELEIRHLKYMVAAILNPKVEKINRFFTELLNISAERFDRLIYFCRHFEAFINISSEVKDKNDLIEILNKNKMEEMISYNFEFNREKKENDIFQILKIAHGSTWRNLSSKSILAFYSDVYKKYFNRLTEKNIVYIISEFFQLTAWVLNSENSRISHLLNNDEFIQDYIGLVKKSRKYKGWRFYWSLPYAIILLIYLVPPNQLIDIALHEEEIFDNFDVLDIESYWGGAKGLSIHVLFKKASNVLNCTTASKKESSIIRVLLNLAISEKGSIDKTSFEKIDYESLANFRCRDTGNEMCRLCLGIANPALESSGKIPADLMNQLNQIKPLIRDEKLEEKFYRCVLKTYENLELKSDTQVKFFLEVYSWIPGDLEYLELLAGYETYLRQVSEGLPSDLNDKDVMKKLDLDGYLIEDGIF